MKQPTLGARLDSWKAVAAYFNRDVKTVQRWERNEGLPIHRHLHGTHGSVYAYADELEDWRARRGLQVRHDAHTRIPFVCCTLFLFVGALLTRGDAGARHRSSGPDSDGSALQEVIERGRYHRNQYTPDGQRKALELFAEATRLAPQSALAHAELAITHIVAVPRLGRAPRWHRPAAESAARRAAELDPRLPEAHMAHGLVLDAFRWDFPGALAALDRAVALRPDYAEAHAWRGMMLAALRRFADALRATEQAVKLAPLSLPLRAQVGWVLFWAGDAHAAIDAWNATVPVDPNFPLARYNLALGYIKLGAYSRAVAELKRALQLVPDRIPYIARLARAEAMAGNPREAERLLGLLYERSTTEYVPHVHFASIHVALGNHDAAVRELERAFHEREPSLTGDDHPESFWWDPLRGDTRFQRLVQGHPVPFVRSPGTFRGPSRFHNPRQFTAQNWIRHGKSTPARQNAPPTLRRVTAAMEGVAFARGAQRRRIRIRSCGAGPRR